MSQGKSWRAGVFGSAPVRHFPVTVSSNRGQYSKFWISDTSQSGPKHGFNETDMYTVDSAVNCILPNFNLKGYKEIPSICQKGVACFCRQSIVVLYETTKNDAFTKAVNLADEKGTEWYGLFGRYVRHALENA